MTTLPVTTKWNVCTPVLYRFLEAGYVDSFFQDGSIRLSSFERFAKHENEQKLDVREGETFFLGRASSQTMTAWATVGINAYILSATMRFDKSLMESFGCDSYFRIENSTKFGIAISKHIPGLISGFEGPCLYQDKKIIERELDFIDITQFKDSENSGKVREDILKEFILSRLGHFPVFLKDKSYSHQVEYRFAWPVKGIVDDYLDIKVPEAIQFCRKPNELTE